jgi:hypothetical protein
MYQIRLNKKDVLNGCRYSWEYVQNLQQGLNATSYKVDISFFKKDDIFIISVQHFEIAGNHICVNYEFLTYEKARKQLSVLNKFYG